ncbi:MAG: N-formylglutamate amidohydrolase [Pseudomonadota bacterium]|nr:N-formylglutamate amidohydrolase [Pseudomonadota bacterium]
MDKKIDHTFEIDYPISQTIPFVFASPHSGRNYQTSFIAKSRLNLLALRRSEDSFIDDLYSDAPNYGAPFLKALFPRAYLDPNREAYELDQEMFLEPLPDFVNTNSPRVSTGLGTVPKIVANGDEIYESKMLFKEAENRINNCYFPYHTALNDLIKETKNKFGKCILIDCHSMPSIGGLVNRDTKNDNVDIVLGNKHGKTCADELIQFVEVQFKNLNLIVRRNHPYAGGYTTEHYGNPNKNVHTLQIEVNRANYMDEKTITRKNGFLKMKKKISNLLQALAEATFNF